MGNIYKMIKMIPLAFLFLSLTVHAQNTIEEGNFRNYYI